MLHMPTPMLMGGAARTYLEWVAHVTSRAASGSIAFTAALPSSTVVTTAATLGSSVRMTGTPWGDFFLRKTTPVGRVVQHGLPSAAVFNDQVARGAVIFVEAQNAGSFEVFSAADRGGYLSQNYSGVSAEAARCVEVSYWNFALSAPQTMGPYNATGPANYSALGW